MTTAARRSLYVGALAALALVVAACERRAEPVGTTPEPEPERKVVTRARYWLRVHYGASEQATAGVTCGPLRAKHAVDCEVTLSSGKHLRLSCPHAEQGDCIQRQEASDE